MPLKLDNKYYYETCFLNSRGGKSFNFIDVPFLQTLTARLIERLRELDPDADAILALWQENDKFSDRAIAKALGRPQRTFTDQMKRYRTELRKIHSY